MSVENPRGEHAILRPELSPVQQLFVASASIIDQMGKELEGETRFVQQADWKAAQLRLRFTLQSSNVRKRNAPKSYHLEVYDQDADEDSDPVERYYYDMTRQRVEYCDNDWKVLDDHPHHDNMLIVLTYLETASSLTDYQSKEFVRIMTKEEIYDPRLVSRLRRLARTVFVRV